MFVPEIEGSIEQAGLLLRASTGAGLCVSVFSRDHPSNSWDVCYYYHPHFRNKSGEGYSPKVTLLQRGGGQVEPTLSDSGAHSEAAHGSVFVSGRATCSSAPDSVGSPSPGGSLLPTSHLV